MLSVIEQQQHLQRPSKHLQLLLRFHFFFLVLHKRVNDGKSGQLAGAVQQLKTSRIWLLKLQTFVFLFFLFFNNFSIETYHLLQAQSAHQTVDVQRQWTVIEERGQAALGTVSIVSLLQTTPATENDIGAAGTGKESR